MKTAANVVICLTVLLILPMIVSAQTAKFGAPDTVYAEVARVNDNTFSITVSCFNDEDIVGIAVPLKMSADMVKVVADSAIYTGGRVEDWSYLGFRPDTAIQSVTLGMIASAGPQDKFITAGTGKLLTLYVSSPGGEKIDKLLVDTTTTDPGNRLMIIARRDPNTPHDSLTVEKYNERLMTPAWVIRYVE